MSPQQIWAPVFACVAFLLYALFWWVYGQRRHVLAYRWISLGLVAFALCAGLAAVAALANLYGSNLWFALEMAALFLAVCAFLVALVYFAREGMRRRPEMQRRRS